MKCIPFDSAEMTPLRLMPAFRTGPERTVWNSPITPRENLILAVREKQCLFLPNMGDVLTINPRIIPDNRARGSVLDSTEIEAPSTEPVLDAFGVPWVYDPVARGSMVAVGTTPLLDEVEGWEDVLTFPDPYSWDWEAQEKLSHEYVSETLFLRKTTIFTGFFERLISFMGFENAAVAMIDEDEESAVHELFDRLADLYIAYIDLCQCHLSIDAVMLHDDWGSQAGPLLSYQTIEKMIIPHLSRVVEHAHKRGILFEMHSCGKIEKLIPLLVEIGVDMWMGQDINDKLALFNEYGDKLLVEVEVPSLGATADSAAVHDVAETFVLDFAIPGKPAAISLYSAPRPNPPELTDEIYVLSRRIYCG